MQHVPTSIALNFGLVMGVASALLVGVAITDFAMVARRVGAIHHPAMFEEESGNPMIE